MAKKPNSQIFDVYELIITRDSEGNEIEKWQKIDFAKHIAENGVASDWSLSALRQAGINPAFPIHTGDSTRIDGLSSVIASIEADVNTVLDNKDSE